MRANKKMNSINCYNEGKIKRIKTNVDLLNLKSDYFLQKLFYNMLKKKKLEIVKYNKKIQNRINLSVKDYKEYCEIEIKIIPAKGKYDSFINIDENDKLYYHIYFNDNKEEIKNKYRIFEDIFGVTKHVYYIEEEDKATKIKIIIDYQVKSFKYLFFWCDFIESINFQKFYRNNV